MYISKGEIAPLFEDITRTVFGAFIGVITTTAAFYFGEPRIPVSPEIVDKLSQGAGEDKTE